MIVESIELDHFRNYNELVMSFCDKTNILFGDNATCIALYPKYSEDLKDVVVYLESIKNTDIHTVVLSIGNENTVLMDSDMIENILAELNATTKIDVRYILNE